MNNASLNSLGTLTNDIKVVNTSGHGYGNARLQSLGVLNTSGFGDGNSLSASGHGYGNARLQSLGVLNTSGFAVNNANLETIGTLNNDIKVVNTSGHGYANARLNSVAIDVNKIINEQDKVDVSVSGWDPTIVPSFVMYGTGGGGGLIPISSDGDGNLTMSTSGSAPIEITSPVLPADSEFLSTATFTFDAGGDIPASDVAVIAAQGVSKRILIYGVTISSTGTSGRGYWYLHDGAFVNDGSPYNKCSGAIDAGNGVAVTNLAFPYPIAIRANYAVNISVTEAVSQAYLVGTVYYKVADYS